jgi:hypothetical protein
VLEHGAEAAEVGRGGREVALRYLDYRVVGARVAEFITTLTAGRR